MFLSFFLILVQWSIFPPYEKKVPLEIESWPPLPLPTSLSEALLVTPTECKLSFSIGTFFENYDVTKRKLYLSKNTPLYENKKKGDKNI